jgi:ABC-type transport system substrate-binding protein
MRYCNAEVSSLISKAQVTYDPADRLPLIQRASRAIVEDVPTIVLDSRKEIFAYNSDLKGWRPNPIAPFDDVMNLDI